MNGAELLISELKAQGVDVLFGYPGGAIMPVYDALVDSGLVHVLVRHEQGAALAANGYARVSGKVGVCMATSGPGATNLVTGIADAFMDSVPMVAITGQVATPVMGTDAFQEVDIFGITLPVVKHSYVVRRIEDLAHTVREAFNIASSGRPGPVLIDLPKDVAIAAAPTAEEVSGNGAAHATPTACAELLREAEQMIANAGRPVLYAGGGIGLSGATEAFRSFVEQSAIPVVTTLHGIGTLPTGHPLLLGMIGMHGSRAANEAVQQSDLLICMGARFDDRATGKLDEFAPNAAVIHMDIDRAEISKLRRANVSLHGDLAATLSSLAVPRSQCDVWRRECLADRERHLPRYDAPGDGIYAPSFIRELTRRDPAKWTITCDVGQHQMWVAQHAHFAGPEQHITSGGLGTMGFGIPAAIGSQFARPGASILAITGDGSFMMNVQELATIRRYNLPIKIVVVDNSGLGLVRQWQECFFDGRYSEVDLSDNPDFAVLATAFGIPAMRVDAGKDVADAVDRISNTEGPLLVHLPIDARANVWPMVPPASSNSLMIEKVPSCEPRSV